MSKIHIVFGPQGAGKSTYSKNLAKEVGGVHPSIMERVERCDNIIRLICNNE